MNTRSLEGAKITVFNYYTYKYARLIIYRIRKSIRYVQEVNEERIAREKKKYIPAMLSTAIEESFRVEIDCIFIQIRLSLRISRVFCARTSCIHAGIMRVTVYIHIPHAHAPARSI